MTASETSTGLSDQNARALALVEELQAFARYTSSAEGAGFAEEAAALLRSLLEEREELEGFKADTAQVEVYHHEKIADAEARARSAEAARDDALRAHLCCCEEHERDIALRQAAEAALERMREALTELVTVIESPAMHGIWLEMLDKLAAYRGPRFDLTKARSLLSQETTDGW